MEKTIFKYPLLVTDFQDVLLPIGAEILTIQTQDETACMWALVNPSEKEKEIRNIEIFGTGHPIGYDMGISRKYISTFQMRDGQLVFHAFERIN
jgi:hypothetical protein